MFLSIVNSTTLFSGPLTRDATSETFIPLISLPFTAVIISPCFSCANSAGVAGITLKISIFPEFEYIFTPIPYIFEVIEVVKSS